ncbi:MAG: membrane protein insertase YidC [Flavobacteriales bacterium]|nr:membrane protein insertase YidC [Flavobacteriales bacterium]MDW8432064.1 membrane protein insertase YidC [Flavobacteriales bacterium]
MDRNSLIGILLIVLTVIVFSIINQPDKEQLARQKALRDSLQKAREQAILADSLSLDKSARDSVEQNPIVPHSDGASLPAVGPFTASALKPGEIFRWRNPEMEIVFNSRGAKMENIRLLNYRNYLSGDTLSLFIPGSQRFGIPLSIGHRLIRTDSLTFSMAVKTLAGDTTQVQFSLRSDSVDAGLDMTYILPPSGYMLGLRVTGHHLGRLAPGQPFDLEWEQKTPQQEKDAQNEKSKSTIFFQDKSGSVDELGSREEEKEEIDYDLKWVGFSQQFFTSTLIAQEAHSRPITLQTSPSDKNVTGWLRHYQATLRLPFTGEGQEHCSFNFYTGPKDYKILKKYDLGLEEQINLGWRGFRWINTLFIINIFQWLSDLNLNYGLIIFILTLIVKIVLSPITYRMYVSSAKMRILKPDIDALNAKYPDPSDALKKNQEMMTLYRRAGVNPLAGCIPALLQMPLLFAMLSFFPSSIELRQQSFLWADDLSTYDAIFTFGYVPLLSDWYGSHVSLLAILMTASTVLYTLMTNTNLGTGPQAQQMKIMMYIMPVFFLLFLNSQPAALCLYYLIANVISILQTIVIREYIIDENKLRARIEENKRRPETKKSKWQQRLEEIQRMQRQRSEELQKRQRRSRR